MATIDHQAELNRAGANINSSWSRFTYYVRRYPLGAAGAIIVIAFLVIAIFAPVFTGFDPTSTNPRTSLAKPGESISSGLISWAGICGRVSSTARASR